MVIAHFDARSACRQPILGPTGYQVLLSRVDRSAACRNAVTAATARDRSGESHGSLSGNCVKCIPGGNYPAERDNSRENIVTLATVLWIVAVVLVIAGIFAIIRKQVIWGVVLIVVGLLVGPGGVSIFT